MNAAANAPNTTGSATVNVIVGRRRRRWPDIKPAAHLLFAVEISQDSYIDRIYLILVVCLQEMPLQG